MSATMAGATGRDGATTMPMPQRAALGFLAGALSVLIFHQGLIGLMYLGGMLPRAPYNFAPTGPLHVPSVLNLCFWAGLYGILFGIALPRLPRLPSWVLGFGLGVLASLVGWFVVAPLKGQAIAGGFVPANMLRSIEINGFWGIGVGLLAPLLIRLRPRA